MTFSLVQVGCSGDDYVKPAALASMESAQELGGRAYVFATGHRYPADLPDRLRTDQLGHDRSGRGLGGGLASTGAVTLTGSGSTAPVTVADQYGNATSSTVTLGTTYSLPITDQVTYITYPSGTR